jgi:hypothetical protein
MRWIDDRSTIRTAVKISTRSLDCKLKVHKSTQAIDERWHARGKHRCITDEHGITLEAIRIAIKVGFEMR